MRLSELKNTVDGSRQVRSRRRVFLDSSDRARLGENQGSRSGMNGNRTALAESCDGHALARQGKEQTGLAMLRVAPAARRRQSFLELAGLRSQLAASANLTHALCGVWTRLLSGLLVACLAGVLRLPSHSPPPGRRQLVFCLPPRLDLRVFCLALRLNPPHPPLPLASGTDKNFQSRQVLIFGP